MVVREILKLLALETVTNGEVLVIGADGSVGSISGLPLTNTLQEGYIFVGNEDDEAAAVPVTGDISIDKDGVTAIGDGVVVDADINANAAIALTKLAAQTANRVAIFNGSGFLAADSNITDTELSALDGIEANIQDQLDDKQETITGGASSITSSNLSPDFVLVSNGSGKVAVSSLSTAKLAFLANIDEDVQAALDEMLRVNIPSPVTGDMIYFDGTEFVSLGVGSVDQVIKSNGTIPVWGPGTSNGLPSGGTTGQYLRKTDGTDYNTYWDSLTTSDITDLVVTSAELNLLSGLTVDASLINSLTGISGNVQALLNAKLANILPQNAMFVGMTGNVPGYLSPGANGAVLTIVAGAPTWSPFASFGTFISLSDVPHDYSTHGGEYVRVKLSEDGLEFVPGGGGGGSIVDANNGLDVVGGDTVVLGGLLLNNTTINGDELYNLSIIDIVDLVIGSDTLELTIGDLTINGSAGTNRDLLRTNGVGASPTWQTVDLAYILTSGNDAMGVQMKGLADGSDPADAVTLSQVATALGFYLPLSGGTMSGAIDMGATNKITSLASPTAAGDAVNKTYADSLVTPTWSVGAQGKVEQSTTAEANNIADQATAGGTAGLSNDRTVSEVGLKDTLVKLFGNATTWSGQQTFSIGSIISDATANTLAWFDNTKKIVTAAVVDVLNYIGLNPIRVAVTIGTPTTDTATLDLNSKYRRKFVTSAARSTAFSIALTNSTDAEEWDYYVPITGSVAITLPSACYMSYTEKIAGRWNDSTKVLTLTGATASWYRLVFSRIDSSTIFVQAITMYAV